MHYTGPSIVLSCQRLTVHNGQYRRFGFVLVLVCFCVCFWLWPVIDAKRLGCRQKHTNPYIPIHTWPCLCAKFCVVAAVWPCWTWASLYRGRMLWRCVHWVHCVTGWLGEMWHVYVFAMGGWVGTRFCNVGYTGYTGYNWVHWFNRF